MVLEEEYGKYIFDPERGRTIMHPPASGKGNWVGAANTIYVSSEKVFYMYYRLRTSEERAKDCYIARSSDGVHFETIWHAHADELGAISIERAALFAAPGEGFFLYLSYDVGGNIWKIDRLFAEAAASFKIADRTKAFDPAKLSVRYVKDPWVAQVGGTYHMYIHIRRLDSVKVTALATSEDGASWKWQGEVLRPGLRWDNYCSRITSAIKVNNQWLVFYDGTDTEQNNCEEMTGILVSDDMRKFKRVSIDSPALTSCNASGSLRYVDALRVGDELYCFYEYASPDASHELRLNII